jgi:hypothetical protein
MSYIAFDLDALNRAPAAARAAGVREEDIIAGLVRLWAWCFREKVARVDADQVRGHFGADVSRALVAFGFLELDPAGGWRVKGADRYLRITEARSEGGKKASGNLKKGSRKASTPAGVQPGTSPGSLPAPAGEQPGLPPGSAPALTPSTEHRAPNTLKAAAGAPLTTAIGWWVEAQRRRETAGLHKESPPHPGKLEGWFAEAMLETNGDEQKLLGGYDAFLVDPFWRNEADKRCAWSGWLNQWRDFVTRATAPSVPGRRDARAPAQPSTGFTNSISEGF